MNLNIHTNFQTKIWKSLCYHFWREQIGKSAKWKCCHGYIFFSEITENCRPLWRYCESMIRSYCYVYVKLGVKGHVQQYWRALWIPWSPLCPLLTVTRLAVIRRGSWDHFGVDSSGWIVTKIRFKLIQDWVEFYISNRVLSSSLFIPDSHKLYIVHIKHPHIIPDVILTQTVSRKNSSRPAARA